jgi:hypothetical protein
VTGRGIQQVFHNFSDGPVMFFFGDCRVAFVNDSIRVAFIVQIFHNFINLQDARHLRLAIDQGVAALY